MSRKAFVSRLLFITPLAICLLIISTRTLAITERGIRISAGRHALVIGNGAYPVSPLKNPVHDAEDMARLLEQLGFTVMLHQDAGLREMETAVREFGLVLKSGGVGLFYYAGHGMQVQGQNYLVPVDARIESASDVRFEAVDVGRVLGKMEDAGNGLNIVILDACRDNPFARGFRSAGGGLARMDAPRGTLIAYATAPGSVAADGDTRNGTYTKNLLEHMGTPGLPVEQVFKNVRIGVIRDTNERQIPWESSSLTGDFYFASPAVGKPAAGAAGAVSSPPPDPLADKAEIVFWESVKDTDEPALLEEYLRKYPQGIFAGIARIKLRAGKTSPVENTIGIDRQETPEGLKATLQTDAREERTTPVVRLRSESAHLPRQSDVDDMLTRYAFFEAERNARGQFLNQFIDQDDEVIVDRRTGLMWQRNGSRNETTFSGAKGYVEDLNEKKFAGFCDWRLPTIEELCSLVATDKADGLHIASNFDQRQKKCWSCDTTEKVHHYPDEHAVWIMNFEEGQVEKANWFINLPVVYNQYVRNERNHVRAVRTHQADPAAPTALPQPR